jgi:O-antigen ligase/Flp pilus assembly protein TadD
MALAASACGLLPASWFGLLPEWRSRLLQTGGFPISHRLSPQPDLTLGALIPAGLALAWLLLLAGHRHSESARRGTLRWLASGGSLIALLALAQRAGWLTLPWPVGHGPTGEDLGPFPNRNHFSTLCAVSLLLGAAVTQDAFLRRSPFRLMWALTLLPPLAGIVSNTSRAGLILGFSGLILWLLLGSLSRGLGRRLALALSLILTAVALLLLSGGGVSAKLAERGLAGPDAGGRLAIYKESLAAIADSPFVGLGLGQFGSIFSLVHDLPSPTDRIIHPESDWLWWAAEMGLIGLLPLLLVAVAFLQKGLTQIRSSRRRHRSPRSEPGRSRASDSRLRLAAALAALMALLHGLVDVPLHGWGLAAWVLLLAALASPDSTLKKVASPLLRWAFRLTGVALLGLAAALFSTALGKPAVPGALGNQARKAEIERLIGDGRYQEALERLGQLIHREPLNWSLHYQRGLLRLQLRQPASHALEDFTRARTLEPHHFDLRQHEAEVWLRHEPAFALIPWRELLLRTHDPARYAAMVSQAQASPSLLPQLWLLASSPPLQAAYLIHAPADAAWTPGLQQLLRDDPKLELLAPGQRLSLLHAWHGKGDRDAWLAALEAKSEWRQEAWQLLADEYALRSDFEKAWNLQKTFAYSSLPAMNLSGLSVEQRARDFLLNPTDARRGVELYFAQRDAGDLVEAARTLEKLLTLPSPPPYLRHEEAALLAAQGDFRRAFETMKRALVAGATTP